MTESQNSATTNRVDSFFLREEVRSAVAMLEGFFGAPVEVWFESGGWCPALAAHMTIDSGTIQSLLREVFQPRKPVIQNVDDYYSLVILPLASGLSTRMAAVCAIESRDPQLLNRLVAAATQSLSLNRRLTEAAERLNAYADHVSLEAEHLCWLQNLTTQIEACDPHLGLEVVGRKVLPELCELIQAEAVVLLPKSAAESPSRNSHLGNPVSACPSGRLELSIPHCHRLIEQFSDTSQQQPVICNHFSSDGPPGHPPWLKSLVLVPVATHDDHFGWLLALNRQPRATGGSLPSLDEFTARVESEFGTIEGGLLKAAGIILASHARNSLLFQQKEAMLVGIVRALVNTIDAKDAYTFGHSDRVALFARRIARELGFDAQICERILLTGLLHDIGKIGVPDAVLQKPSQLTDGEFQLIQRHPDVGYNILKHIEHLEYVLDGVLHHHESYDGRGYPHKLAGTEIPMAARIIAVADAYDAMTSSRPYRQAMPREKAEGILRDNAGKIWDARVVDAFFAALDDIHEISQTERAHAEQILNPQQTTDAQQELQIDDVAEAIVTSQGRQHVFVPTSPVDAPRDVEFHVRS